MGINPLRLLGTVGKGLATVVGVGGVAATSTVLAPQFPFDVNEALRMVLEIVRAVSALIAALGLGRKAGYAANDA